MTNQILLHILDVGGGSVLGVLVLLGFGILFGVLTLWVQSLAYRRWRTEGYLQIGYSEWRKELRIRETGSNTFSGFEKTWLEYDVFGSILRTLALGCIAVSGINFVQLTGNQKYTSSIVVFGLLCAVSLWITIHQVIRLHTAKVI